jgi:hypothetical protein
VPERAFAAACNLQPYDDLTSTGASSTEIATSASTTTSSPTTDATSSPSDTCHVFICDPDWPNDLIACNSWLQDCPPGQKCMPYSGDGDNSWESLGCFPVAPNPGQHGEPCTVEGNGVSGLDTCDVAHMCWSVDPYTGEGHCVKFCSGSPDAPTCDVPNTYCATNGQGILNLCLPTCHPLLQECAGGDVCIPNPSVPDTWICVLDASGSEGQEFDPCEYINACDPGLACLDSAFATECDPMVYGCCLKVCDLTNPVCTGQGAACVPWYEEGQEPPGYEHVGLCRLPP